VAGSTRATNPLISTPMARAAAMIYAHRRGLASSSSCERMNANSVTAIASVSITSGMMMRVKRKSPMQVERTIPA